MIRGRTSPPVPPWEWETAVRGSQGESFWVSRGARCGAVRGKAVAKWCPHYTGISWALETPSFGASLKDGLLFCNRLPRLPSAVLGGSPQKREGVQSATLQVCSPFGNGPTQPLAARKPMNCWGLEEYSGEIPLCTCLPLMAFFGHCQRREVNKRDLSFDPYSCSYIFSSKIFMDCSGKPLTLQLPCLLRDENTRRQHPQSHACNTATSAQGNYVTGHHLPPETCATAWGSCWVLSSGLSWRAGPASITPPPDVRGPPVWSTSRVWPTGGTAAQGGRCGGGPHTTYAAAKDHKVEVKWVALLLSVLESRSAVSTGRGNRCSWDICHHMPRTSFFWSLCEIILFQKTADILQPPLSFPTKTEAVRSPPGFYLCACNCKH